MVRPERIDRKADYYNNGSPPTLDAAKPLSEVLGYHHGDVILQELEDARAFVDAVLGTHTPMYLFGSAARNELRTVAECPEDPSDLDLFVAISDEQAAHIEQLRQQGAPFSSSSTDEYGPHYHRYSIKLPSASGRLNPAELFFYTSGVADADKVSTRYPDRAAFVLNATSEAVEVPSRALEAQSLA